MPLHSYLPIAGGWFVMILFLTIFWVMTLRRLSEILNESLKSSNSRVTVTGVLSLFRFLIRAEYKQTRNERLIAICAKLRQLLYGYLGMTIAFFVFLVIYRPRY